MEEFKRYWQRNGKRRPFPSLSDAIEKYGLERVGFAKPKYYQEGQCPWCGRTVKSEERLYCSDACRREFENTTVWHRNRDPYSLRILYRDNFTCQDCGTFHAVVNENGMAVPADDGRLEVHHIKFVSDGGGDEPENLVTLCHDCHVKRHKK